MTYTVGEQARTDSLEFRLHWLRKPWSTNPAPMTAPTPEWDQHKHTRVEQRKPLAPEPDPLDSILDGLKFGEVTA